MRTKIFIAVLLLFILCCTSQQIDLLAQQQNDQIKKEVKALSDSIFERVSKLDKNVIAQYYSPHLVVVRDTAVFDYKAWKKAWADFMTYALTANWTPYKWECIIIAQDLAISSFVGKFEYTMKSGDKTTIDPIGWSHVWKKEDGQWKVIYENYSGVHVTQKADKK
jgi:ketosteroid isomerase-like protein